uniref:Putative capsid protein n=1 Tax=viral metagenome TaxID=1070528 RepID=A0A6H1ZS65_9ZZZZ
MPDIAITENFGDLLDARVRKIFDKEYGERIQESMIPMIFGMETSTRNYEIVSGIGGLGDIQEFEGQIAYDSTGQLYDQTFTFPEKALGIKIERKLYDDELFGKMNVRPWQMAIAKARTREKTAAAIFNGAFTGTAGPDSVSLCNASHPYSPTDATTQSNAGSTALSATSIEATRQIGFTSIFNDRGELLEVNYDTIVCPIALEETAWMVINSKGMVETSNNNRNFHYGRYQLAMWNRLTDTNNWFMLDSNLCKKFLLWWDRVDDGIKQDQDTDTLVAKWYTYERYATTGLWADWRPIYGHNVS